jgi:hypothetical protein
MDIIRETPMEKRLTEYRVLPEYQETARTFGRNSFLQVTYYDGGTNRQITRYVKELNNLLFEYTVGEGEASLAATILSSIQFPKQ